MRPGGSGRLAVRRIFASTSASYHWLSAPHAPAPSAMHRIAVKPSTSGGMAGAASKPHRPENTTRLITRGLVSARISRQSAGSGAALVMSMAGIGRAYKRLVTGRKAQLARCGTVHASFAMRLVMTKFALVLLAAVSSPALAQQTPADLNGPPAASSDWVPVAIDTSLGRIVIVLDRLHAPITTA